MVLMASGRCDIIAFYTPWFLNRIKAGFFDVRNPFNPKMISRINYKDVDLIMFCTKNPIPIIDNLKKIDKKIIFHITLTPYQKDIEPNVPPKGKIIEGIKKIAKIIGKENIIIRYDPILLNDKYTLEYHKKAFESLCTKLDGYIERIIVSFIDEYKNVKKNSNILKYKKFTDNDLREIGLNFSKIAKKHNMTVQTCFEKENLVEYGFIKGECLSKELAYKMTGKKFKKQNIRKGKFCECVQMADIGVYNSCSHFCKYCYANYDEKKVFQNKLKHNPNSSLLIGEIEKDDVIKIRK